MSSDAAAGAEESERIEMRARLEDLEKTNEALFDMVNDLSLFYNLSLSFLREARSPEQLSRTLLSTLTDEAGFARCAVFQAKVGDPGRLLFTMRAAGSRETDPQVVESASFVGTLLGRCLEEGRSFHSKSMTPAERLPMGCGLSAAHFVLVPLDAGGRRFGAIWVDNGDGGEPITTERFDSLKMLASQVALTVDNLHLTMQLGESNASLQNQRDELNVLYTIVGKIASEHDLERLEGLVLEAVLETLNVDACTLVVFQEGTTNGRALTRRRGQAAVTEQVVELPPDVEADATALAASVRPLLAEPGDAAPAVVAIPVRIRDRTIGILAVSRRGGEPVEPRTEALLGKVSGQVAVALDQARLYDQTITDGLTGLRTRRYFQVRLAELAKEAERYRRSVALLMVDVDHFKRINDTHGHPVGDQVLRQLARTTRRAVRESDLAARYGGEEFVIVLPETDERGAEELGERLRRAIETAEIRLNDDRMLRVTASIGFATLPKDAATPDELVQRADEALYRAKHAGRNRICGPVAAGTAGA